MVRSFTCSISLLFWTLAAEYAGLRVLNYTFAIIRRFQFISCSTHSITGRSFISASAALRLISSMAFIPFQSTDTSYQLTFLWNLRWNCQLKKNPVHLEETNSTITANVGEACAKKRNVKSSTHQNSTHSGLGHNKICIVMDFICAHWHLRQTISDKWRECTNCASFATVVLWSACTLQGKMYVRRMHLVRQMQERQVYAECR